jgi:hypothetical protein
MKYRKFIFGIFIFAIVLVNIWCAVPTFYTLLYKGNYVEIGPDNVNVTETNGLLGPFVPITTFGTADSGPVDTGKKVSVFIIHDFKDRTRAKLARMNLVAFLIGFVLYRWSSKSSYVKL